MAQSYRSRFLAVQRNNEQAMKSLFAALARDIAAEVTRRADSAGIVPRSATFDLQQAAGELVRRLFLGRNRLGEWAPLDTVGNGAVIPLSPYMRQLWESIRAATRIPVEQNAVILANKLPADIAYTMSVARRNPFLVAKGMVSEQVFRPNPLAVYDAPHEWVDPNGYRLSDRVWNVATTERRRLDLYLDTAIREGRGALQMSRELEQFLIPGRSLPATNKPYGTTASFDAMRLARTEISQAHQRASVVSAAMNPFVSGMKWNLSASHPRIDICDDLARGGPNGDGVYSVETYPGRPHPMCLCYSTNVMVQDPDVMIDQLRADVQAAKQEFVNLVGPLEVEKFTQLLLGQGLEVERVDTVSRVITPPVVVRPPAVVTPSVIVPPPVVTPPPPPVDLAAEVRRRVLDLDRGYSRQVEQIEDEILDIAGELTRLTREIDRVEAEMTTATAADQPTRDLFRRLQALRDERVGTLDRRRSLETEVGRIQGERTVRLRALVQVDRPAQVTLSAQGVDPALLREWQRGANEFNNLVSADVAPAQAVPFTESQKNRSSYDPNTRIIEMRAGAGERVVVHELGHWLEDHNPELHRRVVEFYERRTQGDALQWMGPGYGPEERYRRDKWLSEYMGLEYHDGRERYATEVLSMGLDHLYDKTALLAKRDPEMFDFIFNLARGL